MPEQIKDLIEKIQEEGIKAAENQAKEIKKEAAEKAAEIIEKATVEAHGIVDAAKQEAEKFERNSRAMLTQASRDMLLSLRKEMLGMLEALIVSDIRKALTPQELSRIIAGLIKDTAGNATGQVIVSMKQEDIEKMGKGFIEELKEQSKRSIVLRPSEEILGGFIISYDSGKSHYDFSDKALAEYMGTYVKPALQQILMGSAANNKKTT